MNIITPIIDPSVLSTLTRIECTMYTSVLGHNNYQQEQLPVVVLHQSDSISYPDYNFISLVQGPFHLVRLTNARPDRLANVAYQFAHELCHAWIGLGASNALVEVICECASWYFSKCIQDQCQIQYHESLKYLYRDVLELNEVGRISIPRNRIANHETDGRNAMLRLACIHIVPWLHNNQGFWRMLPQLGIAMANPPGDDWNEGFDLAAIRNLLSATEGEMFVDLVNQHAEFT